MERPSDRVSARPRSRAFALRLGAAALGLVALALALLALEGVLALFGVGDEARFEDPYVGFAPGRPVFAKVRGEDGVELWRTRPEKLAFFNDQSFLVTKPEGELRAFVVGGSTTYGRPYDALVAFGAWLQRYLEAAEPGRRFEVVNAGAISYASYRVVRVMEELRRHEPDLFVVYTGHNEFLEERSYSEIRRLPGPALALRSRLSRMRSFALLDRAIGSWQRGGTEKPTLEAEVSTRLDGWAGLDRYHRDPELERRILEHFRANLETMVAIARDAGAEIVFVSPACNLKDFSPFKSEHGPEVSVATRREVDARLRKAEAMEPGQLQTAVAELRRAVGLDPLFAESQFRLGRSLLAAGDVSAARAAFEHARDLDVAPLRAPGAFAAAVREVAAREEVPLVDFEEEVAREAERRYGNPIPGNGIFLDHVHPEIRVHARLGELLYDLLVEQGTVRPSRTLEPEERRAIVEDLLVGLDREYYAERDLNLGKVLGWAGKMEEALPPLRRAASVLTDRPEAFLNLGIALQRTGSSEPALEALRRAEALDPDSASVAFNLGVTLARLGRSDAARKAWRRAVRLDPENVEAWHDLGVLARDLGDFEEADRALLRALELEPERMESVVALAATRRRLGDLVGAEEVLAGVAREDRLRPPALIEESAILAARGAWDAAEERLLTAGRSGSAEAWFQLGLLRARRERPEAALEAYEEAVASDPGHVRARSNLAIVLARAGRLEEARGQLEEAVRLAPGWAEGQLNLAVVYDQMGLRDRAGAALERAAALAPDDPRIAAAVAAWRAAAGGS